MSESYILDAHNRTVTGKQVKTLRTNNLIPAVVYGAGGPAINISCPRRPLEILLTKAGGTHLIKLNIDGRAENALVRDVQRHSIRRDLIHIDFLRVDLTKKLRTEVPLLLVGGDLKLGADLTLAHYMTQIEVESLPGEIPDHIEVSMVNMLTAGSQITVADLPRIPNVEYLADPSDVIVRLEAATGSTADADEAGIVAEPEISSAKGKKEEET